MTRSKTDEVVFVNVWTGATFVVSGRGIERMDALATWRRIRPLEGAGT